MHRKALLFVFVTVISFILGFAARGTLGYPDGQLIASIADIVPLHRFAGNASAPPGASFEKMKRISEEVCARVYPKPFDLGDCFDSLHHGVASSFDPHTAYFNATETKERREREKDTLEGIGVTIVKAKRAVGFTVLDLVPGGVAEEHGIRPGDEIVAVNSVPSSQFRNVYEIARAIRGIPGTRVMLQMKHKDSTQIFTAGVVRKLIPRPQVDGETFSFQGEYYGLVRTRRFNENFAHELGSVVTKLMNSGEKLSGLIISLESNPGGSLYEVNNALDLFMDSQSFVLKRDRTGIHNIETGEFPHIFGDITDGLPILIVVNGRSASASEIFAGAMQHFSRALVYGTKTFGKGTIQQVLALPYGEELSVTIAEYLIGEVEDWIPVQCIGVTPDILRATKDPEEEERFECMHERSLASAGPMTDPPKHQLFRETHPKQYTVLLQMVDAYEWYRLPKEGTPYP